LAETRADQRDDHRGREGEVTQFDFVRTSTGEWRLPDDVNGAIAKAITSGYRADLRPGDTPGTCVLELVTLTEAEEVKDIKAQLEAIGRRLDALEARQ
jgi:hypothetical protein